MSKLTEKQARFVQEYLVDLNATKAAIRAGYSTKTAGQMGHELLKKPEIGAAVEAAQQKREKRTLISQDRVLQELSRIAFFDHRKLYNKDGSLKRPDKLDEETAAALASFEIIESEGDVVADADGNKRKTRRFTKKAKSFDKVAALQLAMRHLGMLSDKLEISRARVRTKDLTGRKDEK